MNDLQKQNTSLPATIEDLTSFVLIGRERLVAVRAEIRAIDKIGLAREVFEQKLAEAQDIADAVMDAEVRLGELISSLPEAQGKRTDILTDNTAHKSKKEILQDAGLSVRQAQRYETLAKHPEVIAEMKATARDNDEIISRTAVLKAISEKKNPYITNNSGDSEWYTPERYIESARKVMGSIDLDPASCKVANETVKADRYYTFEDDGLSQEWYGNIWLNPPYSDVSKFIDKLCMSNINQAIVLTNNATETAWFKKLASKASAMVFHTGRLRFVKPTKELSAPMQGQIFTYIGPNPDRFLNEFSTYGWGTVIDNIE